MTFRADMKRVTVLLAALRVLSGAAAAPAQDLTEIYRIRVVNAVDGPVQVSLDRGNSYVTVGRVNRPATKCIQGFAASAYAKPGTVTATAVHAIRLKAGTIGKDIPQVFSIIPREFAVPGATFTTGEVAGSSGIYTDIPSGTAVFRNLSPLVGNPVFLETKVALRPLPTGYVPSVGDTLVIVVQEHGRRPDEIVFENRTGGRVEALYADRRDTIAVVERPVLGVGRFDATEYTGVGAVNTNHPGVITVSTAPLLSKAKVEPRGGFQILPSRHAQRIGWIPQYMVVAPPPARSLPLEGAPLLFSEYIGLASDPASPANSFRVDVRVGGGDWRSLPTLLGRKDDAISSVSHVRIRFPARSAEWLGRQLLAARDDHLRRKYGGRPPAKGMLEFALSAGDSGSVRFASLYVDGEFRGISSASPFSFTVDAGKLSPGEHCAEIRGTDDAGAVVRSARQWFYTADDDGS